MQAGGFMEAVTAFFDGNAFVPTSLIQIKPKARAIVTILDDDDVQWKGNELDEDDTRIALAIELFSKGQLTIGQAARAARMSRVDFEVYLREHKIPCSFLTYEDVLKDLETMDRVGTLV
jgi:predicted HTH domain antitoxin